MTVPFIQTPLIQPPAADCTGSASELRWTITLREHRQRPTSRGKPDVFRYRGGQWL
jgi:hypothetical protein